VLAEYLQSSLGRKIKLTYGESLRMALEKSGGRADIVIGKQSVVRADAAAAEIDVTPISRLTDLQGSTEQYGMIVVSKDDPAKSVDDLAGYTIIFGPAEAEEKHSAAMQLFREAGIAVPKSKRQISPACSDGACKVIDLGPQSKTAAVISSYAQPLLEGCGTIKKGDLRVVGKTSPVPFVTVFAAGTLAEDERTKVQTALDAVSLQPDVLEALESLVGFMPIEQSIPVAKKN
jgi:ABC-type phosphate/phosphonate transport system substrate-binding protein